MNPSAKALLSTAAILLAVSGSGLGFMTSLSGCSGGNEQPPEQVSRVDRYEGTRGRIVMMPDPANPMSELMIAHEAVPDFKTAEGAQVGMGGMQMPFPVAAGVSLEGLSVGDPVAFDWEVTYLEPSGRRYEITSIEQLPEGTSLDVPTITRDDASGDTGR